MGMRVDKKYKGSITKGYNNKKIPSVLEHQGNGQPVQAADDSSIAYVA